MRNAEEIRLDTRAGGMALLHWPGEREDAQKVLCLHGWLDNAASFIPLAQHLRDLDLYALDFPGHGHSDHRPAGARYAFSEYLFDLDAVLDALGWKRANLMGHSLGGGVAGIYASAVPERVRRVVVLDGLGPVSRNETDTASQLGKSLAWVRRPRRPLRQFASIDEMAKARMNAFLDIAMPAARLICQRASRMDDKNGGHYVWRTDPALKWDSPTMLTEGQVLDCIGRIEAPVLSYHTQPLASAYNPRRLKVRQEAIRRGIFLDIEGNHHFHMDIPEQIAPGIEDFFNSEDPDHD